MGSFTEVPVPFGDTLGCMLTAGKCMGLLLCFFFFFFIFFCTIVLLFNLTFICRPL